MRMRAYPLMHFHDEPNLLKCVKAILGGVILKTIPVYPHLVINYLLGYCKLLH